MPSIKIRGVKSYRSKGRLYHYHRATGIRIEIDIAVDPSGFLARVNELDRVTTVGTTPKRDPRLPITLATMLDAWRKSEEWQRLKLQTRSSYERVIAPTDSTLAAVRARPVAEFTPPFVVGLRDVIVKKHKRWLANYTVRVLRLAFAWGRIHGWCQNNPAQGVPLLPRPQDAPERNRAWEPSEFNLVFDQASPQLRRALLLANYAGMRVGDIVSVTWSCWDGEYLNFRQNKTGRMVNVRAPAPLRSELSSATRIGEYILVNEAGDRYTRDGLQSNLWRLASRLAAKGVVGRGLCFHGLRHSLGTALYDLGLDREARKAALGHTSDAASLVYERGGNRKAAADRAFAALDAQLESVGDKTRNAK